MRLAHGFFDLDVLLLGDRTYQSGDLYSFALKRGMARAVPESAVNKSDFMFLRFENRCNVDAVVLSFRCGVYWD